MEIIIVVLINLLINLCGKYAVKATKDVKNNIDTVARELARMLLSPIDVPQDILSLKGKILKGAKFSKGKNIKLGESMLSWSTLFGNCMWNIPEFGIQVIGTCGKYCQGCFNPDNPKISPCYVCGSYVRRTKNGEIINGSNKIKKGHAIRTLAIRYYKEDLFVNLIMQLTRSNASVIRINQSGELESFDDLILWVLLARVFPSKKFYLYTKNRDAVATAISGIGIPENLIVNVSVWHENNLEFYLKNIKNPSIKAFVYVDGDNDGGWSKEDYALRGLEIQTFCGAYNRKGVMNHSVPCEKCGMCFEGSNITHTERCKVVGCWDH